MEPEVEIMKIFLENCKQWFTMTNIKAKSNKEIDILAIDPKSHEIYHIECRIATKFLLRFKETKNKKRKISHRNGINYFVDKKFYDQNVVNKIKKITGREKWKKWLVVWGMKKGEEERIKEYAGKYGIEIKEISEIIKEIFKFINLHGISGSRNNVLRVMELISFLTRKNKINL